MRVDAIKAQKERAFAALTSDIAAIILRNKKIIVAFTTVLPYCDGRTVVGGWHSVQQDNCRLQLKA